MNSDEYKKLEEKRVMLLRAYANVKDKLILYQISKEAIEEALNQINEEIKEYEGELPGTSED